MDLLTAVLACSLHPDDKLLRAIVQVQSEGNQYFVGDVTAVTSDDSPRTLEDARRVLAAVERKGHRPALGLMGVPLEWATAYGHDVADLWDACVNIQVGTAKLSEFDYECRKRKPNRFRRSARPLPLDSTPNRACIARKYALELGLPPAFVGAVLAETAVQVTRPSTSSLPLGQSDAWGADVFFTSPDSNGSAQTEQRSSLRPVEGAPASQPKGGR